MCLSLLFLTGRRGGGWALYPGSYDIQAQCSMQHAAKQCSAYLLVRLHPNIGVPGTAVHRRSLLPDEVCHLNTPSGVTV